MKGSRAIVSFDKSFSDQPHLKVVGELLSHVFGVPKNHPKSKPFIDHIYNFSFISGLIVFRHYQIFNKHSEKRFDQLELVEIGPRISLNVLKIFDGCLSGKVLYSNEFFLNPDQKTMLKKRVQDMAAMQKVIKKKVNKEITKNIKQPEDELMMMFGEEAEEPRKSREEPKRKGKGTRVLKEKPEKQKKSKGRF